MPKQKSASHPKSEVVVRANREDRPAVSAKMAKYEPSAYVVGCRVRGGSLSQSGGKATRLVAVGLSGRAVVASFASAALGWRLATAHRVVVVV